MTAPDERNSSIEQLAAGYVAGNLTPKEEEEFQQLLADNPELAIEVTRLEEVLDRVLYGLNEVKPPPDLRSAILTSASNDLRRETKPSSFRWGKILGSLAALLILYLGVDNYRLRYDLRLARDIDTLLQHSETRLFPLEGVNVANTASGSFVINLERQQGVITIQNLPTPPAGRIYRVWAIVDGDRIPCGQLTANSQGKVLEKLSMPADFYDVGISGVQITLEPSADYRYPAGPVVMKSIVQN